MPNFDQTKGQLLSMQLVADRLKIRLPALGKLLTEGKFPRPDITTNGVQYWNARTVQTWLGQQPTV